LFILFKNGKELNMLKIGTTIKPSFLGYEIWTNKFKNKKKLDIIHKIY
jgi:hypothetical protein